MVRKHGRLGLPANTQQTPTGSIFFIGSVALPISTAFQNISLYAASKAAVRKLVKPLAMELAPYGIHVNYL